MLPEGASLQEIREEEAPPVEEAAWRNGNCLREYISGQTVATP